MPGWGASLGRGETEKNGEKGLRIISGDSGCRTAIKK
jgi:hypothetical protein